MAKAGERPILLDESWANRAFLAPIASLNDELDERRRYFTTSSRKYVSAAIGGHWAVNPIPQFTDNCDLAHDAFFNEGIDTASRWWSEVLDDNAQYIHFRPGIPRYNSLTTYFGNFYNVEMGSIVRTGRSKGVLYSIGNVLGTIGTLPLQPFILGGSAYRYFFNLPRSKFWYLQPTPFPYRMGVQTMLNGLMANMGMISGEAGPTQNQFFDEGVLPTQVDNIATRNSFEGFLGPYGFVTSNGGLDIFAMSTATARLAQRFRTRLENEILSSTTALERQTAQSENNEGYRRDVVDRILTNGVQKNLETLRYKVVTTNDAETAYQRFIGDTGEGDDWEYSSLSYPSITPGDDPGIWERFKNYMGSIWDQARSEINRGADFVTFRANWTGSQSDSFSNQAGDSSLQQQINGMSSRAREMRFNAADGNVVGGPLGKAMGFIAEGLKDIAVGALDSVQLGGAIALAGNAFADIQKRYESSSTDLNRTTFTMHLRSWSADPYVRLQNLLYPLAHILVLGMPRATGPGSYDGPFFVEVINQGKTLIREGMISNISIERGVGDVGWDKDRNMMGIDVNVTVDDMSSITSVPISGGVSDIGATASGAIGAVAEQFVDGGREFVDTGYAALNKYSYGEDNKYTDYLSTLASVPMEGIMDPKQKWHLRMARMRADLATRRSPYYVGSSMIPSWAGEHLKVIFGETQGRY